jgi:hypothetical protein
MAKTRQMVELPDVMLQGLLPRKWLSLAAGLVRRFWNKSNSQRQGSKSSKLTAIMTPDPGIRLERTPLTGCLPTLGVALKYK